MFTVLLFSSLTNGLVFSGKDVGQIQDFASAMSIPVCRETPPSEERLDEGIQFRTNAKGIQKIEHEKKIHWNI